MASTESKHSADQKENENTGKETDSSMIKQQSRFIVDWKHIAHCMEHEMFWRIGYQTMTIIEQMPSEKVNDLSHEVAEEVIAELRRVRGRNHIYNHEAFIHEMVSRARALNAFTACAVSDSSVFCSRQNSK